MRALFCTDGSQISYKALKNLSNYADKETIIDTICVIDWSFLPDDVIIEETGFVNSCRNVADTILEHSKKMVEESGLQNGEQIKQCGAAVESILEQLTQKEYDLVILGSHGKKGIQRWLGSVSREVLEAGKTPAYLAKESHESKRVLFTIDGSENSYNSAQRALELLNLNDKEIYLCTVSENPDLLFLEGTLDTNWMMAIQTQQEIYSEKSLNRFKDLLTEKNLTIAESIVLSGNPAQSIIDYSKEKGIDLIILGSKSKNKMQKFLLDSVSRRVVEGATSDTIIIKN